MKAFNHFNLFIFVSSFYLISSCGELPRGDSAEDNDINITNNNDIIVGLPDNMTNPTDVTVTNTSDTDSSASSDNNTTESNSNSSSDNSTSSSSRSSIRINNSNEIIIYKFNMIQ